MEENIEQSTEATDDDDIVIIEESLVIPSSNNYLPTMKTRSLLKKSSNIGLNTYIITNDSDYKLIVLDRMMEALSLAPILRYMIYLAIQLKCVDEVLTIVAMETELSISYRMTGRGKELDNALTQFYVVESDHLTLLNCYQAWESCKFSEVWCKCVGLDFTIMYKVLKFRKQLKTALELQNIEIVTCGIKWLNLLKCITQTYISKAAKLVNIITGEYVGCQTKQRRFIHWSSAVHLLGFKPSYVVYHQLVISERGNYMRGVTIIDDEWFSNQ